MKCQLLALTLTLSIGSPHTTAAPAEKTVESAPESAPAGSYILAVESPTVVAGQTYESTDLMKMEDGKLTVDTPQGQVEGTMELSETKKLHLKAIYANKVRILIEKGETTRKTTVNGHEDAPEPQQKPLVGVPVTATLADGKWTAVREDGVDPSVEEAKELRKIAKNLSGEMDRKMYGSQPRKPGDHWTVDAKDSIFSDEDDTKNASGTIELTFDKVEDLKGKKCAFISGNIDVTATPGEAAADAVPKIKMSGKVTIIRALDLQVDLDVQIKGSMEMQMKLPNGGALEMTGPMTLKSEVMVVE